MWNLHLEMFFGMSENHNYPKNPILFLFSNVKTASFIFSASEANKKSKFQFTQLRIRISGPGFAKRLKCFGIHSMYTMVTSVNTICNICLQLRPICKANSVMQRLKVNRELHLLNLENFSLCKFTSANRIIIIQTEI